MPGVNVSLRRKDAGFRKQKQQDRCHKQRNSGENQASGQTAASIAYRSYQVRSNKSGKIIHGIY
jgi:hypothetical protein